MQSTIVLDAGSSTVKAGCGTTAFPTFFRSIAGREKYKPLFRDASASNVIAVGGDAAKRRGLLHLTYPIQHGTIVDWEAWQLLLLQVEQELDTSFSERGVFWVEHPFSSRTQRARVAQILFEEKGAAGMSIGIAPLLSLYATGNTTGIVLDVGEGVSSVAAAVQGYAVSEMMQREDFGGGAVTQYLQRLLREYGSYNDVYSGCSHRDGTISRSFNPSRCGAERELVNAIKEQHCEVSPELAPTSVSVMNTAVGTTTSRNKSSGSNTNAVGVSSGVDVNNISSDATFLDLVQAVATTTPKKHRLPDGTELTLGHELLQAPEVLFNPALLGKEHAGLAGIVANAVRLADIDLRAELCQHVYLTGGSTLLCGFGRRFLSELLQLTPRDCKVRVSAAAERSHMAWLGASFITRLSTFAEQMVVSRAEFLEEGEGALHSRIVG